MKAAVLSLMEELCCFSSVEFISVYFNSDTLNTS